GLIAFTPLAFGTVEPWAIVAMEWGVTTLALLYVLGRVGRLDVAVGSRFKATGLELPLGGFLVLCALQTVPLPSNWLSALSPGASRGYAAIDLAAVAETERAGATLGINGDLPLNLAQPACRPISVVP